MLHFLPVFDRDFFILVFLASGNTLVRSKRTSAEVSLWFSVLDGSVTVICFKSLQVAGCCLLFAASCETLHRGKTNLDSIGVCSQGIVPSVMAASQLTVSI